MLDCSRNAVPNVPYLKRFIDIVSSLGYNELQLYTEDTYEIPSEKYFGYLRGRFSKEEIREIDEYCKQRGVELVPCIQTFAHLDNIFRWAGAAWSWIGLVPHNDYALAAMQAAIPVMRENGVKNYMLAMWGDDGAVCPRLSNLPSIYCFAEMVKGNFDLCSVAEGFYKRFGVKWEDFLKIDTPNLLDSLPLDVYNPAKYMLYNDCFLGIFDSTVNENGAKKYKKYAAELEKLSGDENFGMLFDTEAKLCKVLAQKYSLGIETRRYYALGDRETMRKIVKKYAKTERLLADFYEKLKKQWFYENKPFGFEVQAARIGGLKQRISDCKNRLIGWADGKIGRIEELEEEILDYDGNEAFTKTAVINNSYREIISAGYD